MSEEKQVAKKEATNVVLAELADQIIADAGKGLQNVKTEDMSIPRLAIVQSGSPQRKKKDDKYIEGAEEGHVFNTVTGTLYKGSFKVVPCEFMKSYVEWVPREKGGGLVQSHEDRPSDLTKNENGRFVLPNGNEVADTADHYVMVINEDGSYDPAVMSMTGSLLSVSRNWLTRMKLQKEVVNGKMIEPPTFYYSWEISTREKDNDKGSWFVYNVGEPAPITNADLYKDAKALSESIKRGEKKAAAVEDGDDIPF